MGCTPSEPRESRWGVALGRVTGSFVMSPVSQIIWRTCKDPMASVPLESHSSLIPGGRSVRCDLSMSSTRL